MTTERQLQAMLAGDPVPCPFDNCPCDHLPPCELGWVMGPNDNASPCPTCRPAHARLLDSGRPRAEVMSAMRKLGEHAQREARETERRDADTADETPWWQR